MKTWVRGTRKDIIGSGLRGYIRADYSTLRRKFGKPWGPSSDNKVDVEWVLKFTDGTIASIYNYKDGKAYLGREGKPLSQIKEWHVGGSRNAVRAVKQALRRRG